MALTSLSIGSARFRVGAWQGTADVAYVMPVTAAATMGPAVLNALRDRLRARGYRAVITAALAPRERDLFIDDGFSARSELAVLSRDLDTATPKPAGPPSRTRRGCRSDLKVVLEVDAQAFAPFWQLNAEGLHEARTATPFSRWRVNRGSEIVAYSVTGRAASRGYLQRLAVATDCQGRGLGTLLVSDALAWLRRTGARTALVNTQPDNTRALALYGRCGFRLEPDRLAMLCRHLP